MNLKEMIKLIDQDHFRQKLEDLYSRESYSFQKKRYLYSLERYEKLFGSGEIAIVSAPGRSEISGNHTDHQGGQVLAAAINLDVIAVVSKKGGKSITVYSEGYGQISISLDDLEMNQKEYGTTLSVIKGVLYYLKKEGYQIGAFDAYLTSEVLSGSGLSSSASFEALIGTLVSVLYNDGLIPPVEIARIGQRAENIYFGKPCGLMDQVACSLGNLVHIDFADRDNPLIEPVAYDFSKSGYSLCILDTNASHADLTDEYASIPFEMKSVAVWFDRTVLSEIKPEDFYAQLTDLRGHVSDRALLRAHHFFSENDRVARQALFLKNGRFDKFLELVKESGDSSFKYLQNIYTSKDHSHQAVALALAMSEKILGAAGVARVHGGGFAGTIQAFVKNDFVQEYKRQIEVIFGSGRCHILNIRKHGGIKVL